MSRSENIYDLVHLLDNLTEEGAGHVLALMMELELLTGYYWLPDLKSPEGRKEWLNEWGKRAETKANEANENSPIF